MDAELQELLKGLDTIREAAASVMDSSDSEEDCGSSRVSRPTGERKMWQDILSDTEDAEDSLLLDPDTSSSSGAPGQTNTPIELSPTMLEGAENPSAKVPEISHYTEPTAAPTMEVTPTGTSSIALETAVIDNSKAIEDSIEAQDAEPMTTTTTTTLVQEQREEQREAPTSRPSAPSEESAPAGDGTGAVADQASQRGSASSDSAR